MTQPRHPSPATLGQLRAAGYAPRSVKTELQSNVLARLRAGQTAFPGIVGFDDTVLPELEAALLAGHDLVLLGERGQGKTRVMRTVAGLLDEWTPEVAGCEIHDEPTAPVCVRCRALAADAGDDLPISWRHRDDRYTEKLATPDTSVGDLIGDVDPVKVAQGRTLGDPETVHYGLVPRANRGVFGLNELPDLAERIQVALFNVLEERDIQVRGYSIRLPLDVFLIATANPEDYTNRGRIITPLKDRFGAEIRTQLRGSAMSGRSCPRCSGRWSSRWGRRAGSEPFLIIYFAWPRLLPTRIGLQVLICPASRQCSPREPWWKPGSWWRQRMCSASSAASPACSRC